ncbi:MAG: MOSC N-terminal beta barrel domain-containing protein [Natronomonas sp.]|jgi:hypothetical protein|uniref:MOSC domain-containing protein n=1 Tax=Natronomonas sp. TaxID=2184060 RepID=UPI00287040EB|nr:MOSC N-terminal beta barrel domain-containing protein [Natronomonas sp.]MDR9380444.1 MOSC N-terminal beta barrel domain-containing protein [Natronomonas sp.]MDR9429105.1 MOSC N-terminal beta barrel domain-containing protein [Natronomonas sp.]
MAVSEWYGAHNVTDPEDADPHLATILRFPIKSLDPERRDRATLVADGALSGDRRWAIIDLPPEEPYDLTTANVGGNGDYVNGKKTDAVHRLRSRYHPREEGGPAVTLRAQAAPSTDERRFELHDGDRNRTEADVHADLNAWLSDHFGRSVHVRRDEVGQHDDRDRHGPTVISTATLREVAAWFDVTIDSARRRFRANLEIGGVPPFWEDNLFTDTGSVVAFSVGDAIIDGVHPCQRCVVPGRDPDTGETTPDFRETFVRRRRETLPPWTDCDRFDHPFRLMVNTRVPAESVGQRVAVGDAIEILEQKSV